MPIRDLVSLRPAMEELERALKWAADTIDDIPVKLVPVIQSHGKRARCMGWFSADQWSTREGEPVCEITFAAEVLNRDPVEIVATAVHEVIHLWCHFLDLKDTSKGGRHNKVFKEYAEILGLECEKPFDAYGFGYTKPTEVLKTRIEKEFQPDVAAFNLFRIVKPKTSPTVKTNAWICDCTGLTLRIPAKQVLDATCHKCGIKFVPKEPAEVKDGPVVAGPSDPDPDHDPETEHPENYPFHVHETPEADGPLNSEGWNHRHSDDFPLHQHGGRAHGNFAVEGEGDHDADAEYAGVEAGGEEEKPDPAEPKPKSKKKVTKATKKVTK